MTTKMSSEELTGHKMTNKIIILRTRFMLKKYKSSKEQQALGQLLTVITDEQRD